MRPISLVAWTLAALLLTGCVNLQAVSTYANAAAGVVGSKEPAKRWRDSEKNLVSAKLAEDVCPIGRTGRRPQVEFDAAFEEATAINDLMGSYFSALAELASDKLPNVSAQADGSLKALKAAGLKVEAREEAAVKSLFALLNRALDAYRQKKVVELMNQTHADVATTLQLMEKLADVYADEVRGEGIQALSFVRCSIGQADLADKYLGRRELERVRKHYDAEVATIEKYKKSLQKVQADHEKIREALTLDKGNLEQTLRAIAATAKELDAAREALSNL